MTKKKNILIISLEYYSRNANTLLIHNLTKELNKHYNCTIVTLNPKNSTLPDFWENDNIIQLPFHSLNPKTNSYSNAIQDYLKLFCYKFKNYCCCKDIDKKSSYYFLKDFTKYYEQCQKLPFDLIISFSNPFASHICANALSTKHNIPWIPYYFDPFFSNNTLDSSKKNVRKKYEEKIISPAKDVLMSFPTNENYITEMIQFSDCIKRIEMPGINLNLHKTAKQHTTNGYNCYFIGNLYYDIRNPQSTINLFSKLGSNYHLNFVGGYYGLHNQPILPSNVEFKGFCDSSQLLSIYDNADFLVNIGNTITNQMPSKIFEYISTGIPIINIYKSPKCPTLNYLSDYSNAINIFEKDIEYNTDESIERIKTFCNSKLGVRTPIETIKDLFQNNTFKSVSNTLINTINKYI